MFEHYFADPKALLMGALTGLVFGFLLQKGGVTRYNTIVSQFLFRDFTVLKTMLTAIVVGAVGVWGMLQLGWIESLSVKPAHLLSNIGGGLIFGVGMVILGYCPGTGVAAIGQGSRDAVAGVAGMVAGAALFAESFAWINCVVEPVWDFGKATLPSVTSLSPWLFIAALAAVAVALFTVLERRESRRPAAD